MIMVIKCILSVVWLIGAFVVFLGIDGIVWQLVGLGVWSFLVWEMYRDVIR